MAQGSSAGRIVTGETLRAVAELDCVDLAFAATVDAPRSSFVLDRFVGARSGTLRDVASPLGRGLGGKCIGQRRPVAVGDYLGARGITHEFDRQVAGEGIRAIFAIPVQGASGVCEVVYGATRRPASFSDRVIDRAVGLVARAELSQIASEVADLQLRDRLRELSARLAGTRPPRPAPRPAGGIPAGLTPRELDVLAEVARGHGNAQVADHLGLSEQTVKSYLKSATAKLGAHTRGEAVYHARSRGLLP